VTQLLVAAGSNIDPLANLRRALDVLDRHFAPLRLSRAYSNPPVGFAGEDFVNLVVAFDSDHPVTDVLARLHEAEAACGRPRNAPKWAPRSMDLDILLQGDRVLQSDELTLPRPDLLRRPYMLGPAAEIAPDLLHPTEQRPLAELWREMQQREPSAHGMRVVELGWEPAARGRAPGRA
jgi:2-amino-4-hydroxy-6-hydroxymethyldihydropteridine diphosphokinase